MDQPQRQRPNSEGGVVKGGRRQTGSLLANGLPASTSSLCILVSVLRVENLKHSGMHALEVEVGSQRRVTGWVEGSHRADFNFSAIFTNAHRNGSIRLSIWHKRSWREDKRVCDTYYSISSLCASRAHAFHGWVGLEHKTRIAGELLVSFRLLEKKPSEHTGAPQATVSSDLPLKVAGRVNGARPRDGGVNIKEEETRCDKASQEEKGSPDSTFMSSTARSSTTEGNSILAAKHQARRKVSGAPVSETVEPGSSKETKEQSRLSPDHSSSCEEQSASFSGSPCSGSAVSSFSPSSDSFIDLLTLDIPSPPCVSTSKETERAEFRRKEAKPATVLAQSGLSKTLHTRMGSYDFTGECRPMPTVLAGGLPVVRTREGGPGSGEAAASSSPCGETRKVEEVPTTFSFFMAEDGEAAPRHEIVGERRAECLRPGAGDQTDQREKGVLHKPVPERKSDPVLLLLSGSLKREDDDAGVPAAHKEIEKVRGNAREKKETEQERQEGGRADERVNARGSGEPQAREKAGGSFERSEERKEFDSTSPSAESSHDRKQSTLENMSEVSSTVTDTAAEMRKFTTGGKRKSAIPTEKQESQETKRSPPATSQQVSPPVSPSVTGMEQLYPTSPEEGRRNEDVSEEKTLRSLSLGDRSVRRSGRREEERSGTTPVDSFVMEEEVWPLKTDHHPVRQENHMPGDLAVTSAARRGEDITKRGQEGRQGEREREQCRGRAEEERRSGDDSRHAEVREPRGISDEAAAALKEAFEELERTRSPQTPSSKQTEQSRSHPQGEETNSVGRGVGSETEAGVAGSAWSGVTSDQGKAHSKGTTSRDEFHPFPPLLPGSEKVSSTVSSGPQSAPSRPSSSPSGPTNLASKTLGLDRQISRGGDETKEPNKRHHIPETPEIEGKQEETSKLATAIFEREADKTEQRGDQQARHENRSSALGGDDLSRNSTGRIKKPGPRPAGAKEERERSFGEEFRIPSFPSSSEPSLETLPDFPWSRTQSRQAGPELGRDSEDLPILSSGKGGRGDSPTHLPSHIPLVTSTENESQSSDPTPSFLSPVPSSSAAAADMSDKKEKFRGSLQYRQVFPFWTAEGSSPHPSSNSGVGPSSTTLNTPALEAPHEQGPSAFRRDEKDINISSFASSGPAITPSPASPAACLPPPPSGVEELRRPHADFKDSFPRSCSAASSSSVFSSALFSSPHSTSRQWCNPQEASCPDSTMGFARLTSDHSSADDGPLSVEPVDRKDRRQKDRDEREEVSLDSHLLQVPINAETGTSSSSKTREKKVKRRSFSLVTKIRSHGRSDECRFPEEKKPSKSMIGTMKERLAGVSFGSACSSSSSSASSRSSPSPAPAQVAPSDARQHKPATTGRRGSRTEPDNKSEVTGVPVQDKKWFSGSSHFSRVSKASEGTHAQGSTRGKNEDEHGSGSSPSTAVLLPAPEDVWGLRSRDTASHASSLREKGLSQTDGSHCPLNSFVPGAQRETPQGARDVEGGQQEGASKRDRVKSEKKSNNSAVPFWPEQGDTLDTEVGEDGNSLSKPEKKSVEKSESGGNDWARPFGNVSFFRTEGGQRKDPSSREGFAAPSSLSRTSPNPEKVSGRMGTVSVEPAHDFVVFPSSAEGEYCRFISDSSERGDACKGQPDDAKARMQRHSQGGDVSSIAIPPSFSDGEAFCPSGQTEEHDHHVSLELWGRSVSDGSRHSAVASAISQSPARAQGSPLELVNKFGTPRGVSQKLGRECASELAIPGVTGSNEERRSLDPSSRPPDQSVRLFLGDTPASVGNQPLSLVHKDGSQVTSSHEEAGKATTVRNSALVFQQPVIQKRVVRKVTGIHEGGTGGAARGGEQSGGEYCVVPLAGCAQDGVNGVHSRTGIQTQQDVQQHIAGLHGVTGERWGNRLTGQECYSEEKNPFAYFSSCRSGWRGAVPPAHPFFAGQATPPSSSYSVSPFNSSQQKPSCLLPASAVSPAPLSSPSHISFSPTDPSSAYHCAASSPRVSASSMSPALQCPPVSSLPCASAPSVHLSASTPSLHPCHSQQSRPTGPSAYVASTFSPFSSASPSSTSSLVSLSSPPSAAPACQMTRQEAVRKFVPFTLTAVNRDGYTPDLSYAFSNRDLTRAGRVYGTEGHAVTAAVPEVPTSPPRATALQTDRDTIPAPVGGRSAVAAVSMNPFAALCPQMLPYSPAVQSHQQAIFGQQRPRDSEQQTKNSPLSPSVTPSSSSQNQYRVSPLYRVTGVIETQSETPLAQDATEAGRRMVEFPTSLLVSSPASFRGGTPSSSLSLTQASSRMNDPAVSDVHSDVSRATLRRGFPPWRDRALVMPVERASESQSLSSGGRPFAAVSPSSDSNTKVLPGREERETRREVVHVSSDSEVSQGRVGTTGDYGRGQHPGGGRNETSVPGFRLVESGVADKEESVPGKKQLYTDRVHQEELIQDDAVPRFPSPTPR
ncbi:glutamic acid-rich protein [Cystoisospora suis]|uniref:Glutamic acid-rich protein n=1 Tax=Cystoisospora suis TaxID=483139 RepID=A0A2C6KS59_9APIC|nr:glutamic acid-rich protein [Cystoisospora suis]